MRMPGYERPAGVLGYITTWSKIITAVWLMTYILALAVTALAVFVGFGDAISLQYILETVGELGQGIMPFYFCTKMVENCLQGWEAHKEKLAALQPPTDDSDAGATPADTEN